MGGIPKLKSLEETHNIVITYVNPAYTSQECNRCHYVSTKNRATRDRFKCVVCGYKRHADVSGSRNVKTRRSCSEISVYLPRQKILKVLMKHFHDFLERSSRLYSKALSMGLIKPVAYQESG